MEVLKSQGVNIPDQCI